MDPAPVRSGLVAAGELVGVVPGGGFLDQLVDGGGADAGGRRGRRGGPRTLRRLGEPEGGLGDPAGAPGLEVAGHHPRPDPGEAVAQLDRGAEVGGTPLAGHPQGDRELVGRRTPGSPEHPDPASASTVSPKTGSVGSSASSECMAAHWAAALRRFASAASEAPTLVAHETQHLDRGVGRQPGPDAGVRVVSRERSCMSSSQAPTTDRNPSRSGGFHSLRPQCFVSLCAGLAAVTTDLARRRQRRVRRRLSGRGPLADTSPAALSPLRSSGALPTGRLLPGHREGAHSAHGRSAPPHRRPGAVRRGTPITTGSRRGWWRRIHR